MTATTSRGGIRRLHWGCGARTPPGWVNSDLHPGDGVDIAGDILDGLPLEDGCMDYVVSHHALPELGIYQQVDALRELGRVLAPGGVLRLSLPDLDRAIAAYLDGRSDHFLVWDWDTLAGNFISHVLWYNLTRTPFTVDFATEVLTKAGFTDVRPVAYGQTTSRHPEIVDLDDRQGESFYLEGYR